MAIKAQITAKVETARRWFADTIWLPAPEGASLGYRARRRLSRFLYLIITRLTAGDLITRAASLTYHVVLSLVPLLAVGFSLSKGLGLKSETLKRALGGVMAGQEEILNTVVDYVDRTDVRALGTVGLLLLVYSAVSLMTRIEKAFNEIWGVRQARPLIRRFADYLSVLIIFPLLMVSATGASASLTSNTLVARLLESPAFAWMLQLVPLAMVWVAFTFIYSFMPHTRVKLKASLTGALVAAIVWHTGQWGYIHFQVGVAKYNAIYGTFAALPIFLVWLNLSWAIVLLGCEIAFAVQHERSFTPADDDAPPMSIAREEQATLAFVAHVWRRFAEGAGPATAGELTAMGGLRRKESAQILEGLMRCGLITRAQSPEDALLPARALGELTLAEILLIYRHQGESPEEESPQTLGSAVLVAHEKLETAIKGGLSQGLETWISTENRPHPQTP